MIEKTLKQIVLIFPGPVNDWNKAFLALMV